MVNYCIPSQEIAFKGKSVEASWGEIRGEKKAKEGKGKRTRKREGGGRRKGGGEKERGGKIRNRKGKRKGIGEIRRKRERGRRRRREGKIRSKKEKQEGKERGGRRKGRMMRKTNSDEINSFFNEGRMTGFGFLVFMGHDLVDVSSFCSCNVFGLIGFFFFISFNHSSQINRKGVGKRLRAVSKCKS